MPDDDRIAALFRAAASDVPPPAFDETDVVGASRRITARRRSALLGGAVAVAVVAVIGASVALPRGVENATTAAAPAAGSARDVAVPELAQAPAAPPADSTSGDVGSAGVGSERSGAVPLGPGTTPCADRQDPAVRALVEQALPEVAGAPAAATTDVCRPGSGRYLTLKVTDGSAAGLLLVASLPAGEAVRPADGAISASTASGGTVIVQSSAGSAGGPVPFADRLDATLAFLARRL